MKKSILAVAVAVAVSIVSLTACDKKYNCTCTATSATSVGAYSSNPSNLPGTFKSNNMANAQSICTAAAAEGTNQSAKNAPTAAVTFTCTAVEVK